MSNTTRRELITGGLAAALLPKIGESSPVRSMLGASEQRFHNGLDLPPASEYVQDGLIAMFDGIENAGWGQHSAHALCDLITGYAFMPPAGYSVETDHLAVASTTALQITKACPIEDLSVEYVVAFEDNNTVRECAFENITDNSSFRVKKASSKIQGYFVGTGPWMPFDEHVPATHSIVYSSTSTPKVTAYTNSIVCGTYNFAHTMAGRYGAGFRIGRNGFTAYQRVYCIRIYDRPLDLEEVAYNYELDSIRFNLP